MKNRTFISAAALVTGMLGAAPVMADITAQQAWDSIRDIGQSYGQVITGTATQAGDTLTVSGTQITMDMAEGRMEGDLGTITLTERGDGTVLLQLAEEHEMTMTVDPAEGEAMVMPLTIRQADLKTVISGSPGDLDFDLSARELFVLMPEMTVGGMRVQTGLNLNVTSLAGQYRVEGAAPRRIGADLRAAQASLALDVVDPEGNGHASLSVSAEDLASRSTSTVPEDSDMADMNAMLKAGFTTDSELSYGPVSFDVDFADGADTMQAEGTTQGGRFAVTMNADTLSYAATQTGLDLALSGSDIPLPEITARIAESAFRLKIPATKSDEMREFGLLASYKGVEPGEMIWSMFDPKGVLPHDPANLVVDLSGRGRWLVDFLDPAMATRMTDAPPAEIAALDLNALELSVAGASLTGQGSFTIDNTGTSGDMPKPAGKVKLRLSGGNTLLDRLVELGLLPQEQAQGARMMLGMFARPGDAEDTLVSEIEVTEEGQVLANGQRLR